MTKVTAMSDAPFLVIGHDGDNFLGGRDFDQIIVDWVLARLAADGGVKIERSDPAHAVGLRRLKAAAEDAKIDLTRSEETAPFAGFDAVAAHYLERERLPPLAELLGAPDFYAWLKAHPGFDAYDVGGSLLRWMLDVHGAAKTKRWYTGTPMKQAFGAELPALEKGWREMLAKYVLRPEVETLLRQRDL